MQALAFLRDPASENKMKSLKKTSNVNLRPPLNTHIHSWNKYMPSPPHTYHIYIQKKRLILTSFPWKQSCATYWQSVKDGPHSQRDGPTRSWWDGLENKSDDLSFIPRTRVKVERDTKIPSDLHPTDLCPCVCHTHTPTHNLQASKHLSLWWEKIYNNDIRGDICQNTLKWGLLTWLCTNENFPIMW